jgi:hypothetical protein
LLLTAIVAATTEALGIRTIGAVSVLAGTGVTTHAIGVAAVLQVMALEMARVSAIVLRRRETSLGSRSIGSRPGAGAAERRRGTRSSLGITEWGLQIISDSVARLSRAVE